ncbi:alpha-amylase [Aspergillus stella-maris]|uniref:alpha-amylase n=1 Tax=Aspergillus stella-maris TaxID=1810926 RepID=UPI003CCE0094
MRSSTYLNTLLTASASLAAASPSAQQWAERSIYQVMTDRFARPAGSADDSCDLYRYCGGSWSGIIHKLDYIQDLGFTAVQISPVVENIPDDTTYGEAYHGYWPQNLYALNENFGTVDDLWRLSKELHKREMYLMVEVVINDMAQAINRTVTDENDIDYSRLVPFNDRKYYYEPCSMADRNDPQASEKCWLSNEVVALPDLKTEDEKVVSIIEDWVKGLVGNYSIDGLRVDATKHMDDAYLKSFSRAAGVFTMGDTQTQKAEEICQYQESVSGTLNYPVHESMVRAFTAGDMLGLAKKVKDVQNKCKDFTKLATFTENQNTPRFASLNNDTTLARNAMAFSILSDGIPVVYQGQEQHMTGPSTPYSRAPLWTTQYNTHQPVRNTTATLNKLRNHAIRKDRHYITKHSKKLYLDESTYVTRKGSEGSQVVSVFSNQGSHGGQYNLTIKDAFKPETEIIEVLSCARSTVDEEGEMTVHMDKGQPRIFYPVKKMDGSGLCGFRKRRGPQLTSCGSSRGTVTKGADDDHIVLNGTVGGGEEPEQPSSGAGRETSVSYAMVFLSVFVGLVNWLL